MVADHGVAGAERAGEAVFGGAEDRDHRHAEQRGEMHGAGVVGEQEPALAQLGDEFFERGLADPVDANVAERVGDFFPESASAAVPKRVPLRGRLCGNGGGTSAKRSGSQRLAGPYSAPGQRPISARWSAGRRWVRRRSEMFGAPSFSRQVQVMVHLMLDRSAFFALGHDLIQQPRAPMAAIADTPGILASQTSSAARSEFGKTIATSKAG